jgi:putative endonuclease
MEPRGYHVYIMSSLSRAIYTGVTGDLELRVWQHKEGFIPGHTAKYKINRLVYYEALLNPKLAILREKEIKGWKRQRKCELIELHNAAWVDLAANWVTNATRQKPDA